MRYNLLALFSFLLLSFVSCKKEDKDKITGDDEITTGEFSLYYAAYMDAIKVAEDAMDSNFGATFTRITTPGNNIGCTSIDKDSTATQKIYTIGFSNGCTSYDGFNRSGNIIVKVTNSTGKVYNVAGATTEITFDGYNYRNSKLTGTINLKCITADQFEVSMNGSLILNEGGGPTTTVNAAFLRTTVTGNSDAYLLNNVYEIAPLSGTSSIASGKNTLDQDYNVTFSENLRQSISCYSTGNGRYPVSGILTFSRSSAESDIKIEFGNGDCDNGVTLVRNSTTKSIFY